MYNNALFEGVRAVNDYVNAYLISVLALEPAKYKNNEKRYQSCGFREGNGCPRFLNGSNITQDMIIHTTEKNDGTSDTEIIRTFVKILWGM